MNGRAMDNVLIPVVHLFYANNKSGHTVAEVYADSRWRMADSTWFTVFPGPDGKLLSAAQCHGEGRGYVGIAYRKRMEELVKLPDSELYSKAPRKAARFRESMLAKTARQWSDELDLFAVMNNHLPRQGPSYTGNVRLGGSR